MISIEETALHMAIVCQNIDAIKLLVINGIKTSIKRKESIKCLTRNLSNQDKINAQPKAVYQISCQDHMEMHFVVNVIKFLVMIHDRVEV